MISAVAVFTSSELKFDAHKEMTTTAIISYGLKVTSCH